MNVVVASDLKAQISQSITTIESTEMNLRLPALAATLQFLRIVELLISRAIAHHGAREEQAANVAYITAYMTLEEIYACLATHNKGISRPIRTFNEVVSRQHYF